VLVGIAAAGGGAAFFWNQTHSSEAQWAVVKQYCFECHNRDDLAGDRAFDSMSPDRIAADAETWELAIRKLRGGLMPPAGGPRPDGATVDALVAWLASEIDAAPSLPGSLVRRLNRREYEYAIRDLVALDVDSAALLPDDNVEGFYDNNADALQVSPAFVTQYIDAARAIAQEAVGDLTALPIATTYGDPANMVISLPPDGAPGTGRQQHHLAGMPFGTRGGFTVTHNFPADGEYELTIGDMALAREVPRMEFENTVVVLLDGRALPHEHRRRGRSQGDRYEARPRGRGDQRPAAQDPLRCHGGPTRPRGHVRAPQLRGERRAHSHDRARGRARADPGGACVGDPRSPRGHGPER
jgi:hypothetical protein